MVVHIQILRTEARSLAKTCTLILVVLTSVLTVGIRADEEELRMEVINKPTDCDRLAKDGDMLTMHYTGTLATDGTKFDSSLDRDEPFTFQLGQHQVIAGWEQGVQGMCVGEQRRLHVPASLGYGSQGAGEQIPPNAALVFEIELLNVTDAPPAVNVFKQIDANEDSLLSREEVSEYLGRQVPEDMRNGGEQPFNQDQLVEEIFQHEDQDRNGFISHDEFSGPKHDEL